MPKKKTQEQFISECKIKHDNFYSYDKTIYVNDYTKVIVTCPIHFDYEISAHNHLVGQGCKTCGDLKRAKLRSLTTEQFIELSNIAHNNFYSYPNTIYRNQKEKVEILCPIHGPFMAIPTHHQRGVKCPDCGKEITRQKTSKTNEVFIQELLEIFGDTYDLSKTEYVKAHQKVIIGCKVHGDILMTPHALLKHQGCKQCYHENTEQRGWSRSEWVRFCEQNNYLYPSLYIINLNSSQEDFIKIGITVNKDNRFAKLPFNKNLLNEIIGKPEAVYNLEKKLHKTFKQYRYKPLQKFGGETECFSTEILKDSNFQMFLQK